MERSKPFHWISMYYSSKKLTSNCNLHLTCDSFRRKDLGMWLRHAIDTTSVLAARNGTLPAEWFDRPYLLHDESQHERFLVSTGTVNAISAQLLMYQTSLQHLFVNPYVIPFIEWHMTLTNLDHSIHPSPCFKFYDKRIVSFQLLKIFLLNLQLQLRITDFTLDFSIKTSTSNYTWF